MGNEEEKKQLKKLLQLQIKEDDELIKDLEHKKAQLEQLLRLRTQEDDELIKDLELANKNLSQEIKLIMKSHEKDIDVFQKNIQDLEKKFQIQNDDLIKKENIIKD